MESVNFDQEKAQELKDSIELNSFSKDNLDSIKVQDFEPTDLLESDQIQIEKEKHDKRDRFYERFSINTLLKFCLKERDFKIIDEVIQIESGIDLGLPEGYGFKGGAARTILRKSLGLKSNEPRDFDLIRVGVPESCPGADDELASRFMEKDFEFGDGVEFIDDVSQYLKTRDFTINELYVLNNKIYATENCVRDTLRNIIRVTDYELQNYYDNKIGIGPKMKAKVLRFHVEQLYTTGVSEIYHEDKDEIESSFINPFWIAVQLDRAFERSSVIANKFTEILLKFKIIPNDIKNAADLVIYLEDELDEDFYFRSVPVEIFELEDSRFGDEDPNGIEFWEKYFDRLNKS